MVLHLFTDLSPARIGCNLRLFALLRFVDLIPDKNRPDVKIISKKDFTSALKTRFAHLHFVSQGRSQQVMARAISLI